MYWRKTGPDDCRHIQLGTKSYSVKYIISEAVRPWIRDAVGLLVTSTPRGRLILRLSLSGSARQIFGTLHDNLTASTNITFRSQGLQVQQGPRDIQP